MVQPSDTLLDYPIPPATYPPRYLRADTEVKLKKLLRNSHASLLRYWDPLTISHVQFLFNLTNACLMTALQAPFANSVPGSPGQSTKWFDHRTPSWIIRFTLLLILRDTYAQTPRVRILFPLMDRKKIFIRKRG
ncbi:hypothetical protein CEXT_507361 [Caerostris extrusa]|uniref:Uncharacterized protein n=1 Tax=Caerostris extrusa TaxID=172846 RepID=A0AAV4M8S3_CAEEX|nr:hypothetical protein CEXT_507361 [Caerostris extrusa]